MRCIYSVTSAFFEREGFGHKVSGFGRKKKKKFGDSTPSQPPHRLATS
jgi:hypothetical protein